VTVDIDQTYQLGFELRCNGNYGEAKQVFQKIIATSPNHVNALHQLALIQGFEGDFDGSLAALGALSAKAPNNLNLRYDLAMTQMMLGMYDEACANLKMILTVDSTHEKALTQISYC
jgi:thioredoxin-like negative regulator of GroEL